MQVITLLFLPLVIAIAAYLFGGHRITFKEVALQVFVSVFLVISGVAICHNFDRVDSQIHSGNIVGKRKEIVRCSHSYSCHCRQVGKHTYCDTCYMHLYDVNWAVRTDIDSGFYIAREDLQGIIEPKRWSKVYTGEPYVNSVTYTNYIKASPDSLFKVSYDEDRYTIPKYPKIYDYYKIDRFISEEIKLKNIKKLNSELSEANSRMWKKVKANLIVVITRKPDEYVHHLKAKWVGAKINDIVVVISYGRGQSNPKWAEVISWDKGQVVPVMLKDIALNTDISDMEAFIQKAEQCVTSNYVLRDIEDFSYLKESAHLKLGTYIFLLIINVIISIAITCCMWENDIL